MGFHVVEPFLGLHAGHCLAELCQAGTALLCLLAHFLMPARRCPLLLNDLVQHGVLVFDKVVVPCLCAVAQTLMALLNLRDTRFALFQHGLETLAVALFNGLLAPARIRPLQFTLDDALVV